MAPRASPCEFSAVERRVLLCLFDAIWPDLGDDGAARLVADLRRDGAEAEALRAYARRPASGSRDVVAAVEAKVGLLPPGLIAEFHLLLRALANPVGCMALMGQRGPIYRLPQPAVQAAMQAWGVAAVPKLRQIAKQMKMLTAFACVGAGSGELCPNWSAMGYEAPGLAAMRAAAASAAVDFAACRVGPERPLSGGPPPEVLCDCVVVGSGPGGAVMTAELAEAGFKVALLESASWASPQEQGCSEQDAFRNMYQESGNFFTEDTNFVVLAGAAFGGGGAINWNCCLPPTQQVLEEWSRDFGVEWASGAEMAESVERVRERLAMQKDRVRLNRANEILMQGCASLGYPSEVAAQQGYEPRGPEAGWCSAGWKHGHRQGMHGSALADAAEAGGLLLLDGCTANEVLRDAEGRACAVRATLRRGGGELEVLVRGRAVVAAGGALQTPLLLRRSGLRNRHIGRHLSLHPAMTVFGRFEEKVDFIQGAPMTTCCRVVEDQDGKGYGAKIWVPNFHPITWGALVPWQGAEQYKRAMAMYAHSAPLICLARDHGEGRVWQGGDGHAHISYAFKAEDKAHLLRGVEHAVRILVAAGAQEVHSSHAALEPLLLGGGEGDLEAWLARLHAAGLPKNGCSLGSAHQMSTCRMAASAKLGAAKPSGETWEVPGLFVADTSAFPTASGVNPMWTCAAVAHRVAQHCKAHLRAEPALSKPAARRVAPCCGAAVVGPQAICREAPAEASEASTEASSEEARALGSV